MSDRIHALTVVLDRPIRADDAEAIINAIKMVRHVADVQTHVTNPDVHFAVEKARNEIKRKLFEVLEPELHEQLKPLLEP